MKLLFLAVVAYAFILFGVWLVVPHLGFRRVPIPKVLPPNIKKVVNRLNNQSSSNKEYLKNAYNHVTTHYCGSRVKTLTHLWYLLKNPLDHKDGFMYCMHQNYLLMTLLIGSGRFRDDDIKIVTRPFNFFIHQYIRVKIDRKWINVDPWAHFTNVKFGEKHSVIG